MGKRYHSLRQIMPEQLLTTVELVWPNWENLLFQQQCAVKRWYRNTLGILFRLGLLVCAIIILCVVLLFFAKGLWEVYLATPMGQGYAQLSWQTTTTISTIFAMDLLALAIDLTAVSLTQILVVGATTKLIVVKRYFYDGRGVVIKLIWFGGCGFLAARDISTDYNLDSGIAQLLCVVPVAALFSTSFTFISQVIPECNIVKISKDISKLLDKVRMRNNLSG